MSTLVFFAVIGAAVLHAVWNALVKSGSDKKVSMGAVVLGHMPIALILLPFIPAPAFESMPYLAAGILLHFGYQLFLLKSYETGDLTQVYPIARGSAPLIVALFSVTILGVQLDAIQVLAILVIGGGIISLALVRQENGQKNSQAARLALTTGLFIASYSLMDGQGARISGTSLGFYSWLVLGNGLLMILYLLLRTRTALKTIVTKGRHVFLFGGSASFIAYAIITWAFTQAPIALVTALRETSIVFALLIGVLFLKERLNLVKVFSTFTTLMGAVLLRFAK